MVRAIGKRLAPYAPALLVSVVVGAFCVRAILRQAHELAAPLDDTFIHFQYARRLAEGHFFSYVEGEGYTSGATSLLWPVLLAPFHKLGLRGLSLLWAAWALGTLAHAALAVETFRITRRLAGAAAAAGAGAMCALFGAFAWFAWSGMETVPFAWILMRTARVAGAHCEPEPASPPRLAHVELIALGLLAPLLRPEGAIASLIAAIAIATRLPRPGIPGRLLAVAPLAGPLLMPLLHLVFTGHAASSTTIVKWMIGNPHYGPSTLWAASAHNLRTLLSNVMDGGDWTAVFLPERSSIPILLGAAMLPLSASRRRVPFHGLFLALIALGTLVPCTYLSFLWNRLRYVWPFAPAWFVLVACFAREAGDLVRRFRPRFTFVTPLLAGGFAGALAAKLPWTVSDLAQSATAIAKQQVTLARWAADKLPPDARIGVNDTGAIAYLGGRRTFDVVGLTTRGEARYWVAGPGSRYEHYERTPREKLPTHFIVYPHWMSCAPVLGKELMSATVMDQSILGGATMIAYEARWDTLGSGALPAEPPAGLALFDAIDVADLESEREHRYELAGGTDAENHALLVGEQRGYLGELERAGTSDGGRLQRTRDRFEARLPAGKPSRLVMRVAANDPVTLRISLDAKPIGTIEVAPRPGAWVEPWIELPAGSARAVVDVTLIGPPPVAKPGAELVPPTFHAFHYWIYAAP